MRLLPQRDEIIIQFAHPAYRLAERFFARNLNIRHFQSWTAEDTIARAEEANVLVISGLWEDKFLERAINLCYVQAISAGYEQFPVDKLCGRGIRLSNASGVNADAVSQHAMGLILSLSRQFHFARDYQNKRYWRPMISKLSEREDDLIGQTALIIGLGAIGSRLARLAKSFGMRVLGVKQDVACYDEVVDEVYSPGQLTELFSQADFVVLCCPLIDRTRYIIDTDAFAAMISSSYLVNVARGGCVEEDSLATALIDRQIAGAAIDHFRDEPLPKDSLFWGIDNLIITPHSAGETRKYEDHVVDILMANLDRLWEGEGELINQIV